ncbi:MAG: endonuclease/exonuclease/phosphatase family protein [Patescibacteria group bacterium]|nr:endonuclease/exonuclease/phosphatase family protein [Patescibacteria group bacterium]
MKFSLLTFNILFNKGFYELKEIIKKYKPDIICVQEINTKDDNLKQIEEINHNYQLADFSNYSLKYGNIFGMVTYYKKNKFIFNTSEKIPLNKTFLDNFVMLINLIKDKNLGRSFLKTEFIEKKSRKKIIIYNTHLTVFTSNKGRIKYLNKVLKNLKTNDKKTSFIFAGDFNYLPYNRKKLENMMKKFGFKEATKNINYTIEYARNVKNFYESTLTRIIVKIFSKFFTDKLKIDYIFYKNLFLKNIKKINVNSSDHYPLLVEFELAKDKS